MPPIMRSPEWAAFNEMIGVGGWRGRSEKNGPFWFLKEGKLVSDPAPGLPAATAGVRHFRLWFVRIIPSRMVCPRFGCIRVMNFTPGFAAPERICRFSRPRTPIPANNGTGHDEPMLMTLSYGRGRVFHTTLGHDINALSSVDFVVTFQRGTEWAATGKVTAEDSLRFPHRQLGQLSDGPRGHGSRATSAA